MTQPPPAMTYNRDVAVRYATANWEKVVDDGYFWNTSTDCHHYGAGVAVPTKEQLGGKAGDDCAHFVCCCIGAPSGAGIVVDQPYANSKIPAYRAQYGDPSAGGLRTWLVDSRIAVVVNAVTDLVLGDLIAYDWEGNGSTDHIALYMGDGLITAHAVSHWNAPYDMGRNPRKKLTFLHITVPHSGQRSGVARRS